MKLTSTPGFLSAVQTRRWQFLLFSSLSCLSARFLFNGQWFPSVMILMGLALVYPHMTVSLFESFNRFCNRRGWNTAVALSALSCVFLAVTVLLPEPAHAMFFANAETWMKGTFKGIDASMISMIFGVIRATLIIYVGIATVRVAQSMQRDEDWQTLARTPLVLMVSLTIGDTIVEMIIGGATTAG